MCVRKKWMGHFTVVLLVAKPLIWSEVEVDHVVIKTSILLAWWQSHLHLKSGKVCIITRSPLASLLFKGLATKHITVKWTIGSLCGPVGNKAVFSYMFLFTKTIKLVDTFGATRQLLLTIQIECWKVMVNRTFSLSFFLNYPLLDCSIMVFWGEKGSPLMNGYL